MKKSKQITVAAREAGLIARKFSQLETEAAKTLAETSRSFRMVAAAGNVQAVIKAPGLTVQFENGSFAVDIQQKEAEA